jgi:hypothetical protein
MTKSKKTALTREGKAQGGIGLTYGQTVANISRKKRRAGDMWSCAGDADRQATHPLVSRNPWVLQRVEDNDMINLLWFATVAGRPLRACNTSLNSLGHARNMVRRAQRTSVHNPTNELTQVIKPAMPPLFRC